MEGNRFFLDESGKNKKASDFSEAFAVRTGLEPATPCVTGMYSNQLNYRTKLGILLPRSRIVSAKV